MARGARDLRRLFEAAVVGASALGCGGEETTSDAGGNDATLDDARQAATDAELDGPMFDGPMFSNPDAYVWCEAGPPEVVAACGSCCSIYDVPCGISPDQYADDAGDLWHCDRICGGYGTTGCSLLTSADKLTFVGDAALEDGGTYVVCGCTGRRPQGLRAPRAPTSTAEYFATAARLEAASVFAFERLHAELEECGAPLALLERVQSSIADEQRHARTMDRIARRFGASVTPPRRPRFRKRNLEALAIENAIEGCVRETYGALVATWQATHASDARVRRAMRAIARDETRHAALASSVAAFVATKLDDQARARVRRAEVRAVRDTRVAALVAPHRDLVRDAGVPTSEQARALFDHVFA